MNETLQTIAKRKSCRSYQNQMIKEEELQAILKAGIQAPSAMNRQLCEIYAITNLAYIDELTNAIKKVSEERGEKKPDSYHFSYHAPVLCIVSGPEYDSRRVEDGSCILENIFLAAASLNIGSCWINQLRDTQNVDEVRNVLNKLGIPPNHQVVGCAAIGYVNQEGAAKEKNESRIHIVR